MVKMAPTVTLIMTHQPSLSLELGLISNDLSSDMCRKYFNSLLNGEEPLGFCPFIPSDEDLSA